MSTVSNIILSNSRHCARISEVMYSERVSIQASSTLIQRGLLCVAGWKTFTRQTNCFNRSDVPIAAQLSIWLCYSSNSTFLQLPQGTFENDWLVKSPHLISCNSWDQEMQKILICSEGTKMALYIMDENCRFVQNDSSFLLSFARSIQLHLFRWGWSSPTSEECCPQLFVSQRSLTPLTCFY